MNLALAPQYLINGLLAGIIYATYTTGYSLVLTTSRFMHVCHGGILSISGLLMWYLCASVGVPMLPSALAAAGTGVVVGLFLEIAIYRRLRRRGLPVRKANNDVLSGIRVTAQLLKEGKLVICSPCRDAIREFGLYRWDTSGSGGDRVVKEHAHAMDDIRYFAATVATGTSGGFFAGSVERTGF